MKDELNELGAALAAAQAEMSAAAMSGRNPHFSSKYASLSDIWEACRKPLTANGLTVIQLPANDDGGRIGLTTVLLHKSGQNISSTLFVTPQQNTPQGVGSALTYLRRYGLAAIVGVVADDDDDGNAAGARPAAKATPKPAAPKPEAPTNGNGGAPDHSGSDMWRRWYELVKTAEAAGVSVPVLDDAASDADIVSAGKTLKARIIAAKQAQPV